MRCPACGFEQPDGHPECVGCGVIFKKLEAARERRAAPPQPSPGPAREAPAVAARAPVVSPTSAPASQARPVSLSLSQKRLLVSTLARGLRSGLSMPALLGALQADARGPLSRLAARMRADVEGGDSVSVALKQRLANPGFVMPLLLQMGEGAGQLDESLDKVGAYLDELMAFRKRLISPLIYPSVVVLLSFFIMPIPKLVFGPPSAYWLEVGASLAILAAIVGAFFAARALLLRAPALAEWGLSLPVLNEMHRFVIATVFQQLLVSGHSLRAGFDLLAGAYRSDARRARVRRCQASLDQGQSFADAVEHLGVFKAEGRLMIRSGEHSGELDAVFAEIAAASRERVATKVRLAAGVLTALVGLAIFAALAMKILGQYQGVLDSSEDLLRQIEAETPIRIFPGK
jgi:type II secretory pathway component PulF